jgi:hypothetical protein
VQLLLKLLLTTPVPGPLQAAPQLLLPCPDAAAVLLLLSWVRHAYEYFVGQLGTGLIGDRKVSQCCFSARTAAEYGVLMTLFAAKVSCDPLITPKSVCKHLRPTQSTCSLSADVVCVTWYPL